jgi:hypothetical protein
VKDSNAIQISLLRVALRPMEGGGSWIDETPSKVEAELDGAD